MAALPVTSTTASVTIASVLKENSLQMVADDAMLTALPLDFSLLGKGGKGSTQLPGQANSGGVTNPFMVTSMFINSAAIFEIGQCRPSRWRLTS